MSDKIENEGTSHIFPLPIDAKLHGIMIVVGVLAGFVTYSVAKTFVHAGQPTLSILIGNFLLLIATIGVPYVLGILPKKMTWQNIGVDLTLWQWKWVPMAMGLLIFVVGGRLLCVFLLTKFLGLGNTSLAETQPIKQLVPEWVHYIFTLILVGVVGPFAEEFFYRGIVQRGFDQWLGAWPAIILSALLFGCMHLDAVQSPAAALLGLCCAIWFMRTGSLWPPVILHVLNNLLSTSLELLAQIQ